MTEPKTLDKALPANRLDRAIRKLEDSNPTSPGIGQADAAPADPAGPTEIDGPEGPDPTRFGDWERNGRCIDF